MLEQEMASIIKYVLDTAGNPAPYYWNVPQSFKIPSIYFPPPEVLTGADSLGAYSMEYAWNITVFSHNSQAAYDMAVQLAESIRLIRNLIPLIDTEGNPIAGHYVRVDDPTVRVADTGACLLMLVWTSRRHYQWRRDKTDTGEKMVGFTLENWLYPDLYLETQIDAETEASYSEED